MIFIVDIISSSPKRHNQLRATHDTNISNLIANGEIETGSELHQILQKIKILVTVFLPSLLVGISDGINDGKIFVANNLFTDGY